MGLSVINKGFEMSPLEIQLLKCIREYRRLSIWTKSGVHDHHLGFASYYSMHNISVLK